MGLLNKKMPETEVIFPYSPALSNVWDRSFVYFNILVKEVKGEMMWTYTDMTFSKWKSIIDIKSMEADITKIARRKFEKQLQTR